VTFVDGLFTSKIWNNLDSVKIHAHYVVFC